MENFCKNLEKINKIKYGKKNHLKINLPYSFDNESSENKIKFPSITDRSCENYQTLDLIKKSANYNKFYPQANIINKLFFKDEKEKNKKINKRSLSTMNSNFKFFELNSLYLTDRETKTESKLF